MGSRCINRSIDVRVLFGEKGGIYGTDSMAGSFRSHKLPRIGYPIVTPYILIEVSTICRVAGLKGRI